MHRNRKQNVAIGAWRSGNYCSMGTEFQSEEMKKFGMDGGDGRTIM